MHNNTSTPNLSGDAAYEYLSLPPNPNSAFGRLRAAIQRCLPVLPEEVITKRAIKLHVVLAAGYRIHKAWDLIVLSELTPDEAKVPLADFMPSHSPIKTATEEDNVRRCRHCHALLPDQKRNDSAYCDAACAEAARRERNKSKTVAEAPQTGQLAWVLGGQNHGQAISPCAALQAGGAA